MGLEQVAYSKAKRISSDGEHIHEPIDEFYWKDFPLDEWMEELFYERNGEEALGYLPRFSFEDMELTIQDIEKLEREWKIVIQGFCKWAKKEIKAGRNVYYKII